MANAAGGNFLRGDIMSVTHFTEERCVTCGEIIEEGRQVCLRCEKLAKQDAKEVQETTTRPRQHSSIFARLLHRKGH